MSNSPAEPLRTTAEPLVTPEWLANRLRKPDPDAPDPLILDIRSVVDGGGRQAYESAHIPGAIYTDYANDGWRVTKGMASGLLPEPAALVALFSRIGLTPRRHAIIVSAGTTVGDFSAAARVYWTLKIAGHDSTSILSGGMVAWGRDATRPLEAGPPPVESAVASLSGQACACVARRCRCGGTCDRRSDRGPARQSGHDLLPREREISASPAARASPGRGPARSRRGLRFHCDGVEAQGRARNSCSRRSLRRRSSTIATPATRPRPTGSCCPRCSGVPEYRCMTARCRNGRRSPIARWRWGRASPRPQS